MFIVGKILKPRGLKGFVKVEVITSFPEHLKQLKEMFIKAGTDWVPYSVQAVQLEEKFAYLKFAEISSADEAEKLRNQFLYIPQDQLTLLQEHEFYIHDLIGLQVFDEQNNLLGQIVDVESYASNDVYVLENSQGRQHLIPAIKDIVKQVDVSAKRMVIHLLDGLLD